MDMAKFIRILGCITYRILCLPIIILTVVLSPVWVPIVAIIFERGFIETCKSTIFCIKTKFNRDINFMKTGEWL